MLIKQGRGGKAVTALKIPSHAHSLLANFSMVCSLFVSKLLNRLKSHTNGRRDDHNSKTKNKLHGKKRARKLILLNTLSNATSKRRNVRELGRDYGS